MKPQPLTEYDIFERIKGELIWRASVPGREAALDRAKQLAAGSHNQFLLMHLASNEVVATFNAFPE